MNLNNIDISKLPADIRRQYKQLQVLHAEKKIQNKAKNDFLSFVKCMWPDFIEGSHHRHIADKFNKLSTGEINRLIINMPPRHTKSEFASYLLPAWMVGRDPKLKIIQATHTGELAVRFGRKAKNLIDSEDYGKIFKTRLQEDSKAAGRWETAQGGEYFAAGVGGAITGRGADLLIIDDPHSEQDAMSQKPINGTWSSFRQSWTTEQNQSLYGLSIGNSMSWRRYKQHCPLVNGMHSGCKTQQLKKVQY
jgi:hypothetical protein